MSTPTMSNLLTQMYQNKEVLNGWDAVMNVLESAINSFFLSQWQTHTEGSGVLKISGLWCDGVNPMPGGVYLTNVTEFSIQLGTPLFQFTSGQNEVSVTQDIMAGSLRIGTKEVPSNFSPSACGCQVNDPSIVWGQPVAIDASQKPSLTGQVALSQVIGMVQDAQSLILNFAEGSFTLNNLSISGVTNSILANQIKNWFATNSISYILTSLNTQNLSGLSSLTPSSFKFNVVTTNAGNTIVQILITTNGGQPQANTIEVSEPIPTADNLTCSLMVNSRIVFSDILAKGFNQTNNNINLVPTSSGTVWSAYINPELHFSGSFSFGSCCDKTTVTYSVYLGGTFSGSTDQGFSLYQSESTSGNVHVDITVTANYPVGLSGSGNSQTITITPGTPHVSVTGSAEGEIKSTLEHILDNNFKNGMGGISFSPVTYFALKNILFPGQKISMSQVQVPTDLLIVGNFQPT